MTTAMHTETQNVPTVTLDGRRIIIRRTPSYGRSIVGYIDPPDAERACNVIRGALADAYTAGCNRARIDVLNIVHACTDHDDDGAVNGADLIGGNDYTDGLIAWIEQS